MNLNNTVCFDFDGVICPSEGKYQADKCIGAPTEGIPEIMKALHHRHWRVVVFSARASDPVGQKAIWDYLKANHLDRYVDRVTAEKEPARVYVDDRGLNFNGNTKTLLRDILTFTTYQGK